MTYCTCSHDVSSLQVLAEPKAQRAPLRGRDRETASRPETVARYLPVGRRVLRVQTCSSGKHYGRSVEELNQVWLVCVLTSLTQLNTFNRVGKGARTTIHLVHARTEEGLCVGGCFRAASCPCRSRQEGTIIRARSAR